MPPLNSPSAGPPQKLVRQAVRPTTPRLQHTALERRIPPAGSHRPVGQRLPTAACPQKSGSNLSQRPVIYRPQQHQKHTGLLEFQAPSRPPEADNQARGRHLDRNAGPCEMGTFGQRGAAVQARNRTGHHTGGEGRQLRGAEEGTGLGPSWSATLCEREASSTAGGRSPSGRHPQMLLEGPEGFASPDLTRGGEASLGNHPLRERRRPAWDGWGGAPPGSSP